MIVLGINEGHSAAAALLIDGKIVAAAQEERFCRNKRFAGWPEKAVAWMLSEWKVKPDKIVLSSRRGFLSANNETPWLHDLAASLGYHVPGAAQAIDAARGVWDAFIQGPAFTARRRAIAEQYGCPDVTATGHQYAHALAAVHTYPELMDGEPAIVLSADGMGNHHCAAVYRWIGGKLEAVALTPNGNSLAFIYGMVTKYMGMRFLEHEYKIMGLAPYADPAGVARVLPILEKMIWVESDLRFHSKFNTRLALEYLDHHLKRMRFDWIAGAAQMLVEKIVTEWAYAAMTRLRITRVVLAGGLFQNVKANMAIAALPLCRSCWPCPGAGDESTALGAAIAGAGGVCELLRDLYLGPEAERYKFEGLGPTPGFLHWHIENIERHIAELLAAGKIVARHNGRAEFGPRALGNRSILADPSRPEIVEKLNRQIKCRDFWMPFAATVLNPRPTDGGCRNRRFMTMADRTNETKEGYEVRGVLCAAIHPYDKTIRPQVLHVGENPSYEKIITEFKRITAIPGVLNTSFNLHGEPIVNSVADALDVFRRSGLEYLAVGDYLITKESAK